MLSDNRFSQINFEYSLHHFLYMRVAGSGGESATTPTNNKGTTFLYSKASILKFHCKRIKNFTRQSNANLFGNILVDKTIDDPFLSSSVCNKKLYKAL